MNMPGLGSVLLGRSKRWDSFLLAGAEATPRRRIVTSVMAVTLIGTATAGDASASIFSPGQGNDFAVTLIAGEAKADVAADGGNTIADARTTTLRSR